jgi:hypothetical protein
MYHAATHTLIATLFPGLQAGVVTVINTVLYEAQRRLSALSGWQGPLIWCGLEDGCICLVDAASRCPQ